MEVISVAVFISDSVKSKYDLFCPNPKCRSKNNIHVAGVYEFKNSPDKWYCRCGTCGRSFTPRKRKEDSQMASIMEVARKALPKHVLGTLLAAGKTNKEIGQDYDNLPHWAVSGLKKEYWPNGFDSKEYKQSEDTEMNDNEQNSSNLLDIHSLVELKNGLENDINSVDKIRKLNLKLSPNIYTLL